MDSKCVRKWREMLKMATARWKASLNIEYAPKILYPMKHCCLGPKYNKFYGLHVPLTKQNLSRLHWCVLCCFNVLPRAHFGPSFVLVIKVYGSKVENLKKSPINQASYVFVLHEYASCGKDVERVKFMLKNALFALISL
jgi:hypothetical protein